MSTSGITAWSLTAREIILTALQEARIYGAGEEPTADDLTECLRRLNGMLKSWQGKANLFRETTGEVEVPGGSGSGTLDAGIRDISSVRVVVSATQERQLWPWTRSAYLSLPNKAQTGSPTAYYHSRQIGGNVLHLWPVPLDDVTLKIDYSRVGETITDASQTVDIPEEWQETVYANLAVRIADLFGAQPSPLYVQRAEMLYQQMLDSDRPDAYTFEAYDGCYG